MSASTSAATTVAGAMWAVQQSRLSVCGSTFCGAELRRPPAVVHLAQGSRRYGGGRRVLRVGPHASFTESGATDNESWQEAFVAKPSSPPKPGSGKQLSEEQLEKEKHRFFDEVTINVRAGRGGDGAVFPPGAIHASSELPSGSDGGDIYIVADESQDTLLPLHKKNAWSAKRGVSVDIGKAVQQSESVSKKLRAKSNNRKKTRTSRGGGGARAREAKEIEALNRSARLDLRIRVPAGTTVRVRSKRRMTLLADLVENGDEVLVARGGIGGSSTRLLSRNEKIKKQRGSRYRGGGGADDWSEVTEGDIGPEEARRLARGEDGEEFTLQLILRVVADVGLVGLPNAGKSSLLNALTRARPEIAPYPFTTLMPNLGFVTSDEETQDSPESSMPDLSEVPDEELAEWIKVLEEKEAEQEAKLSNRMKLADLPGLIEGAHKGKGLGRMFLRHLRRAKVLLHVVDASLPDPLADFLAVRNELRLYNPEYVQRPCVVALNKIDIEGVDELIEELRDGILREAEENRKAAAEAQENEKGSGEAYAADGELRIVPVSALGGRNLDQLRENLDSLLKMSSEL